MGDKDIKEEFNVEEASRRMYEAFIDGLRRLLAGNTMVQNRPVLPSVADIPSNHQRFEIVIRTTDNEVTFLFRRRDLFLEAYRSRDSSTWYEFQEKNQTNHVVEGSQFLGFTGNYSGGRGLEVKGTKRDKNDKVIISGARSSIPLGQYALRNAVNTLATSDAYDERARSLIVVIQMISESLRFEDIQFFIVANWTTGAIPSDTLLILENNWGDFSNALLRSHAHPDLSVFPIRLVHGGSQHTYTFELVVAVIALLAYNVEGIPKQRRAPRSADDGYEGRALLEVFAVIVNNIDGESPGDLYGTIRVTDGLLSQYIYNRERGNYESIYPNGKATLTGPTQSCVSALDGFIIEVALMDKDADLSPDDEVSKGEIAWSVYDIYTNVYDKTLFEKIDGSYGSVNVVYGILSNAVQAYVEVTMINGDGEDPADVYGSILAGNNDPEVGKQEIALFQRGSGDYIGVGKGALIPLSRSIVAVPLKSELIIRADLFDYDTLSSDDEIAKGSLNFPAKLAGEVEGFISGEYGQIKVKVTWVP